MPHPDNLTSLTGLFREGDLLVTQTPHLVNIDLTVRRSGATLYSTGDTLNDAVDSMQNELYDHTEALDHLQDLGIDDLRIVGELVAAHTEPGEFDPAFVAPELHPMFIQPPTTAPVQAAAGEPIDTTSEGYVMALLIPVVVGKA